MLGLVITVIVCGGLIGLLLPSIARGLRTGTINAGGRLIERRDRPALFWLAVIIQILFAGVAGYVLYLRALGL